MTKMSRQLNLYWHLLVTEIHGQDELMRWQGCGLRMLQRDLKDLRDAEVINVKYEKEKDSYVYVDEGKFDREAAPRHKQHLIRLHRLCTLLSNLTATDMEALESFSFAVENYNEWLEEELAQSRVPTEEEKQEEWEIWTDGNVPEFADLKSEYYELFPDSNERMRQRDFKALTAAGFPIYYERKYQAFIFEWPSHDEYIDEEI